MPDIQLNTADYTWELMLKQLDNTRSIITTLQKQGLDYMDSVLLRRYINDVELEAIARYKESSRSSDRIGFTIPNTKEVI